VKTATATAEAAARIVVGATERHAQETAGRSGELHADRLQAARGRLAEAEDAVRDDARIRVALPDTAVPGGRTMLTVTGLAVAGIQPGPARAWLLPGS
jgi:hypothetical protein